MNDLTLLQRICFDINILSIFHHSIVNISFILYLGAVYVIILSQLRSLN